MADCSGLVGDAFRICQNAEIERLQLLQQESQEVSETPADRKHRLREWRDEEVTSKGLRGSVKRVAVREGVSAQRISAILRSPK